ncbi:hypothetical protein I5682_23460 [Citrobacter werkmanii]|nr:hypothetical protein [Citrobacter werkmanii]MBJ9597942.1 hypothetical protein [Citrobacter werkmanii]MBJ9875433.1 hypothetical protein [Citrobacter werkmanii]HEB0856792.1 hypothetical protein [Citrobacter freundii]
MAGQLDDAAKQILATLLTDFMDRGLSAKELKKGYEGPKIDVLATAVCDNDEITKVDFEVSFGELEDKKLVKTGPMTFYENKPDSQIFIMSAYSKREYAYLTEAGYKEARKSPNKPMQPVKRVINNVNISGGQFSNLQLATGDGISQSMAVSTTGADSEIVAKLIAILESQGQVVADEQRADITAAVAAANEGDGKQAKSLLAKVCGQAWESVQPVMWPIVGELVKKSLGL